MHTSSKESVRSLGTPILALALGVAFSIGATYVYAWTGPTGAAPNNNTPTPINVGSTEQTKSGGITFGGYARFTGYGTDTWFPYTNGWNYLRGPTNLSGILYDEQNNGYQLDLNGTNRINYIVADNTYTYGNADVSDVYIRAAGRWASAPAVSMDCYDAVAQYCDYGTVRYAKYCRTCVNNSCSAYTFVGNHGNCIIEGAPI